MCRRKKFETVLFCIFYKNNYIYCGRIWWGQIFRNFEKFPRFNVYYKISENYIEFDTFRQYDLIEYVIHVVLRVIGVKEL